MIREIGRGLYALPNEVETYLLGVGISASPRFDERRKTEHTWNIHGNTPTYCGFALREHELDLDWGRVGTSGEQGEPLRSEADGQHG